MTNTIRVMLTDTYDEEYAERLRDAVGKTILSVAFTEIEGERVALVRNWELFEVFTEIMVSVALTDPSGKKPAQLKKLFDRKVNRLFRAAREAESAVRH